MNKKFSHLKILKMGLPSIAILLTIAMLSSLSIPVFAQTTPMSSPETTDFSKIQIEPPHAPPGYIDLTTSDKSINGTQPQPDFANPRVFDSSVFWLGEGQGSPSGAYAYLIPQTIHFETDWYTRTQEYWVQTVVVKTDEYKAEIGLDIKYGQVYGFWVWTVDAYAAVSEDPNGYSYVIQWYRVSANTVGPYPATVGVYEKDAAGNWGWAVNGVEFANHLYPERWAGYYTRVVTEAYNQPVAGSGGTWISVAEDLHVKRSSDGWWTTSIYYPSHSENGVYRGWIVDIYANDGYKRDMSIRY